MSNLSRHKIAEKVADRTNLTVTEIRAIIDLMFDEMTKSLVAGEKVQLTNFGKFDPLWTPKRPGRNPKTGQPISIQKHRRVAFRPSAKLKELIAVGPRAEKVVERQLP